MSSIFGGGSGKCDGCLISSASDKWISTLIGVEIDKQVDATNLLRDQFKSIAFILVLQLKNEPRHGSINKIRINCIISLKSREMDDAS